jgi:hypothetical protein
LIVVKLKMPLGGRSNVVFVVTSSAPSAPVLPEEKPWAKVAQGSTPPNRRRSAVLGILMVVPFARRFEDSEVTGIMGFGFG